MRVENYYLMTRERAQGILNTFFIESILNEPLFIESAVFQMNHFYQIYSITNDEFLNEFSELRDGFGSQDFALRKRHFTSTSQQQHGKLQPTC